MIDTTAMSLDERTDLLFEDIENKHKSADAESVDWLRDIARKSARDAEWHTLWFCMMFDGIRQLFNSDRIAKRLDEMRAEMRAEMRNA